MIAIAGEVKQSGAAAGIAHPRCANCGAPVVQRRGERPSKYAVRKACSPECARVLVGHGKAGRPKAPPHSHASCEYCGGLVVRSGSETRERWIARKYCSVPCRSEAEGPGEGWPENTGSELRGTPFAAHNRDPGDGGMMRYDTPATHVPAATVLGGN